MTALEGLAWRLKTLLHNGKETPWDSAEQRRYYELVVSKLLDPDAPAMPPQRSEDLIAAGARALFDLTNAAQHSPNPDRMWERLCADGDRPYSYQAEAVLRAAALARHTGVRRLLGVDTTTENAGKPHVYLSTSCLHAAEPGQEHLHERCSADTALDAEGNEFARRPARCKFEFCQAPCVCPCHEGGS